MLFDGLLHVFRPASASHAAALLLLALAPFQVGAQSLADKVWWASSHNKMAASVAAATGSAHPGIPYLTPLPAGSANLPAGRIVANANGWPDVAVQTRPRGGPVIDVKARIQPASAGAAIGRYLTKAGPIANAVALATLAAELGFIIVDGVNGAPEVKKQSAPPQGYDGKEWSVPNLGTTYYETRQAACTGAAYQRSISGYPYDPTTWVCANAFSSVGPGADWMQIRHKDGHSLSDWQMSSRTDPTPFVPTEQPSTTQELADAIASKSGWPTSSTIGPVIAEAIKKGEGVQTDTPRATGPATSPGTSTTTTRPDGKIETKTTTNNYTYNTNTVTITQTTTTSVFNPSDGTTETTTEETTEELPPDSCETNPNSLGCAELDTPTGEIPTTTKNITYTPASGFGGSGSCPADRSWTSIQTGDTHTASFRPVCDALDLLKPMFIAIAFFMAYMIVLPRSE